MARVSRGERTQDPETQVAALEAAAIRKGWQVVDVQRHIKSAWEAESAREVSEAALRPIKEGRADVLMVWSLDRLVRGGPAKAYAFLDSLERHYGASLFSLQEPFLSTATTDPAMRELMVANIAWAAKWESQRKSERLTAKASFKRQAAGKLGQRALWGRGMMATDEDRRNIRQMSRGGATVRAISKAVGLSIGTVQRTLKAVPPQTEEQKPVATENQAPAPGGGLEQPPTGGQVARVQPQEPMEPVGNQEVAAGGKA